MSRNVLLEKIKQAEAIASAEVEKAEKGTQPKPDADSDEA